MEKIVIASDHAGFELKQIIINELIKLHFEIDDKGCFSSDSVDYPDFAHKAADDVDKGIVKRGIVICGSGNGVNMTANKHQHVRSALCWNEEIAHLARLHNDANILALPARFITTDEAVKCLYAFLNTDFEGGRHINRVNKIPLQ
ncbi:MAG: ribose 5-phosphate isomerase B [Bacteroidales bacterium]